MVIKTKYFGSIEVSEQAIIHFPNGIFGFETEKEFALLSFTDEGDFMLCMQSVHDPFLAFTLLNPFPIMPDYRPRLLEDELRQMGVERSEDLCYYVLCRVSDPISQSSVNLRCPIVLNDITRQARQVILDEYEMRCPLSSFQRKKDESC